MACPTSPPSPSPTGALRCRRCDLNFSHANALHIPWCRHDRDADKRRHLSSTLSRRLSLSDRTHTPMLLLLFTCLAGQRGTRRCLGGADGARRSSQGGRGRLCSPLIMPQQSTSLPPVHLPRQLMPWQPELTSPTRHHQSQILHPPVVQLDEEEATPGRGSLAGRNNPTTGKRAEGLRWTARRFNDGVGVGTAHQV